MTVARSGPGWLPACVLLLSSCSSDAQPSAAETPASANASGAEQAKEPVVPDRAWHMQETFWMAVRARDALIAGDLALARNEARELEHHDYGNSFPADWKHYVEQMKQHAQGIVLAAGIADAAQQVGALGLACGDCHHQSQAGPGAARPPPVPWQDPPDTLTERMDRHYAGVDQLWQGLVQPSEDAWRNGTITLTRAPLQAPHAAGTEMSDTDHAKVEHVRELAQRARAARSHPERAQIYGELIATCADCHANQITIAK